MDKKSKLDDFFSEENKLTIEKPKTWPKVIAPIIAIALLCSGSFWSYKVILNKRNPAISNESKIVSRPGGESLTTQDQVYDPYENGWYPGKALDDLEKSKQSSSNYVPIALPGGYSIPDPESVVNTAPTTSTTPASETEYGSTAQACLDMFNSRKTALEPYKQELYDIKSQIDNVEGSVRARSIGSLVTQSQMERQIEAERQRLVNLYNEAVKEYNAVSTQYPTC